MNAWMGLKASEGVRERLLASCCGPIVDVLTFDKIVGRVAISGSKLRGLTRRWVELFILPEQLPSPSPFFGRAESVAEMIEAKRRVSRLKECLRLADEVLALVPTQQQMPPSVRQKEGYFFAGSSEQISSWKKDNAGVVTPETYELQFGTIPLNGVPINWKKITELRQDLAICLTQCGIEYPDTCNIREEKRGGQTLVHEKAWRCCMKGLQSRLVSELESARCEVAEDSAKFVFKRTANTWRIHFNGNEMGGVQDAAPLRDIHYLLSRPNEPVSIFDLPDNKGTNGTEGSVEVATRYDASQLRQQYNELKGEVGRLKAEGAPELEIQEAEEQLAAWLPQWNQNFDKDGNPRRLTGPLGKAIGRTKKRFKRLLDEWAKGDELKELTTFLEKHVTIATDCKYEPPPNFLPWET